MGVVLLLGVTTLIVFAVEGSLPAGLVSVVTAAFGVIGSVVGAYFGLKIGTDQAKDASVAAQAAEAKSSVYAAHVPAAQAGEVTALAMKAASDTRRAAGRR